MRCDRHINNFLFSKTGKPTTTFEENKGIIVFRLVPCSCKCRQRQQRIRIYFNLANTFHSAHSWNISTRTKHLEYQNSIHFPQEEKPAVCVHVRKSEPVLKYNLKCWWKLNTLLKMLNTDTFAPSTPWSFWWWMFLFNIFYYFHSMPFPFTTSS